MSDTKYIVVKDSETNAMALEAAKKMSTQLDKALSLGNISTAIDCGNAMARLLTAYYYAKDIEGRSPPEGDDGFYQLQNVAAAPISQQEIKEGKKVKFYLDDNNVAFGTVLEIMGAEEDYEIKIKPLGAKDDVVMVDRSRVHVL